MPKRKIKADPAYQLARDLTEHSTRMLLPVVYNEGAFAERDVIRLLTMMRVDESAALEFAPSYRPAQKLLLQLHDLEKGN